jgi:hypothetical protein
MITEPSSHVSLIEFPNSFVVRNLASERRFKVDNTRSYCLPNISVIKEPVYPDNSNKSEDDTNTPRGIFEENISQFLTPEWLPIFFVDLFGFWSVIQYTTWSSSETALFAVSDETIC